MKNDYENFPRLHFFVNIYIHRAVIYTQLQQKQQQNNMMMITLKSNYDYYNLPNIHKPHTHIHILITYEEIGFYYA